MWVHSGIREPVQAELGDEAHGELGQRTGWALRVTRPAEGAGEGLARPWCGGLGGGSSKGSEAGGSMVGGMGQLEAILWTGQGLSQPSHSKPHRAAPSRPPARNSPLLPSAHTRKASVVYQVHDTIWGRFADFQKPPLGQKKRAQGGGPYLLSGGGPCSLPHKMTYYKHF